MATGRSNNSRGRFAHRSTIRFSRRCHALFRVPLGEFSDEDLRIMIGQNLGLRYLIPIALDRLQKNPWRAGDMYEGDLLAAVLRSSEGFWENTVNHSSLCRVLAVVEAALLQTPPDLPTYDDILSLLTGFTKRFEKPPTER